MINNQTTNMDESVDLIEHSIREPHHVISDKDLFYTQNWHLPFSTTVDKYYSPYFTNPSFKIVFLLSFDEKGKSRLYGKLAGQNTSDFLQFYFQIGNPNGKKISFTYKWEFNIKKQSNLHNIYNFTKYDIINNNQWLNEDGKLNIYFEISHKTADIYENKQSIKRVIGIKKKQGFGGLINRYNVCYMNSSLQILFHITEFLRILYSYDATNDETKTVLRSSQFLSYLMKKSTRQCDPFILHDNIPFCKSEVGMQKDAHEFIIEYFKNLKQEISGSEQEEKLNGLFMFHFNSIVQSLSKCYKKVLHEANLCLDLPLVTDQITDKPLKLIDCIHKFQSKSIESKYTLDSGEVVKVEKWLEIVSFPSILTLHLLRTLLDSSKDETLVEFGEELDLTDISHDENDKFELYSILAHQKLQKGGHFYSYVRDFQSGDWYKFNDSVSSKCKSPLNISDISKLAYLLFYVRKSDKSKLFDRSMMISTNVRNYLVQKEEEKKKADNLKNTSEFKFILEEEVNLKCSINDLFISDKKLKIHKSKTNFDLYKEVSDLFNKNINEIRLWLINDNEKVIINKSVDKSIDRLSNEISPKVNKFGQRTSSNKFIVFVQNISKEENIIPFIENLNFESFNCITVFLKFFDPRFQLPIRYIGPLLVEETSKIDLPQIRILLDLPSTTKFHFFIEMTRTFAKQLSPTTTFKKAQLDNGSVLIVQVDDVNLPDLSISSVLKDVELGNSNDISNNSSNSIICINKKKYNAADILTDINKNLLSHYLAFRYSMNHFYIYDYTKQDSPEFLLDMPSSFTLKDLCRVIKEIKDFEDEKSIWIFDKLPSTDEASYNFITDESFEKKIISKDFSGFRIYYLYQNGIHRFDKRYIYKVQIAADGYNVSYKTAVIAPRETTPAKILELASDSLNFPDDIEIPDIVYDIASSQIDYHQPYIKNEFYYVTHTPKIPPKPNSYMTPSVKRTNSNSNSEDDYLQILKDLNFGRISYDVTKATPEYTHFIAFEVDKFQILKTFEINDKISLESHTIRYCSYIPPSKGEIPIAVSQVLAYTINGKVEFKYIKEPFIINLNRTLTVKEFKEKALNCCDSHIISNKEAFLKSKLKILKKFSAESSSLEKDDDVIKDLRVNSLIYVIYN